MVFLAVFGLIAILAIIFNILINVVAGLKGPVNLYHKLIYGQCRVTEKPFIGVVNIDDVDGIRIDYCPRCSTNEKFSNEELVWYRDKEVRENLRNRSWKIKSKFFNIVDYITTAG